MNRQENLIQILLKAEKPLTTQELAEQLNVSSRTIRSDLEKIESEILVHSMKLEKKPRVGIWIEGTQDEKDALFLDVKGEHDLVESYSKEYRRGCILVQILLSKNKIYPYKLQNNLYVSKSTIEKDLQEISKWLEKYDLSLMKKPSIGLYVSGDEENIRNAVAALAGELSEKNQSIESLMETYLDIDVKEIEDIIHNWNDNYNMHLNEVNINNLAFHASVMLMRIGKNKALLIENSKALDSETFSYKEEFDILINELSTYGNCEIPKDEADYLLMHLLGMYLNESSFLENDFLNDLRKIAENIAEDFILKSDKIMSLDLESNDQFKRSLMLHLLPTVYRLKYGLNLYNPLLNEIKTNQKQTSDEVKSLVQKLKTTIEDGVHNFKHHRIGFETPFVFWTIVIETALIFGMFTWIIISGKPNQREEDNDLKYRYIKMKGDASAEQIATLEDVFELNRNNEAIEQMREDVETYEEAVRKQAALAEQARLKEQAAKEQESKDKSIKNKQDDSKVNLNNKSKP